MAGSTTPTTVAKRAVADPDRGPSGLRPASRTRWFCSKMTRSPTLKALSPSSDLWTQLTARLAAVPGPSR